MLSILKEFHRLRLLWISCIRMSVRKHFRMQLSHIDNLFPNVLKMNNLKTLLKFIRYSFLKDSMLIRIMLIRLVSSMILNISKNIRIN